MRSDLPSWRDIRNTSAFRLTLLLGSAAILGMLALLLLVYSLIARELNHRSDQVLRTEIHRLDSIPDKLLSAQIAASIRNSTSGLSYFALMTAGGRRIVGNFEMAPIPRLDRPFEIEAIPGIHRPLRIIGHRTQSGTVILIGRDIQPLADLRKQIVRILLLSALLITPLLLLASLALSIAPLRRVNRLQRVARSIGAGDLDARMPIRGRGDELDLLATTVNQMVEAVGRTVAQVKSVTDAIAHDLRTPLTHVRNQLYRTSREMGGDTTHEVQIEQSIEELDFVIERFAALMRISELEATARTSGFATLSLSHLAMAVADLYTPLAEDKDIALRLFLDDEVRLFGDEKLIFEAVSNLLDNAIKFAPEGGHVTLTVGTSRDAIVLTVKDDGPGIAEDKRQAVLRRFDRGEASAQTPGSGLGLSIVAAIVHLHHFSLEMDNVAPGLIVRIVAPHPQRGAPAR